MIVGVGVDLVDVKRVRALLERHGERARRRLFTTAELAYCDERAEAAECLAARVAAKEAAFKALGTGKVIGLLWTDVEVRREDSGTPVLELRGEARAQARQRGADRTWLSISHEGGFACAFVVLESRAP